MRAAIIALLVCSASITAHADDATSRHLLAGVRAFHDEHYEDALVELRVVARAPDAPADLAFYLGPTLYKLGRYREALVVFVTSRAAPDALTDFYAGETYFQLHLYRKARVVFAGLRTRGLGPALDEAAGRYVDAVDAAYKQPPESATIDFYVDQGLADLAHDPVLAGEELDEARQAEALSSTRPRHAEILAALGAAWNATARTRAVIDVLAADHALSPEGTWQLARAYVVERDVVHARPLLDSVAKAHGPHADEATVMLAKLAP